MFLINWLLHHPIQGAYTELFAGLAPNVQTGSWGEFIPNSIDAGPLLTGTVAPWGRSVPLRKDLATADKSEAEGGSGSAAKFWDWTEEQVKLYL